MVVSITVFQGDRLVASGDVDGVTRLLGERRLADDQTIRAFDDESGRLVDLDFRGAGAPRGRGRPRLGVAAREVTLLPRHWDWLAGQPGGASATLRRLVEEARRGPRGPREARDAAYRFMQELAGDMPGYEEALRALYRGERDRFEALVTEWPGDVRDYAVKLAWGSSA